MEACSRDPNGILVALDSVQDPQNLGSVLRSAAFFGVRGVLLPRDRSVGVVPSVFRASAGAAAIVPVAQVVNLARALRRCLELDVTPVAAVARGGDSLSVLPASGPLVLVLGSEAEGLRRLVLEACPIRVTLPSPGKFESLNVGVTAGILMHAILAGRPSESVQ
jgi:23S rRNA (guanosine2251-2'-O)-methyltransferase